MVATCGLYTDSLREGDAKRDLSNASTTWLAYDVFCGRCMITRMRRSWLENFMAHQ